MYGMKKMKRKKMADGGMGVKPDFLDLDKDGDKQEPMSNAAQKAEGMMYGGAVKDKKKKKMYVGGSVRMKPAKQMNSKKYAMNRGGIASLRKPMRTI
tara:strand:- start:1544 stop:1834 length:291 start_codon:yes stop_codon:yes gene_type:complete